MEGFQGMGGQALRRQAGVLCPQSRRGGVVCPQSRRPAPSRMQGGEDRPADTRSSGQGRRGVGLGEPRFSEGKPHCVELGTRNKLEVTPVQAGLVPKCVSAHSTWKSMEQPGVRLEPGQDHSHGVRKARGCG